jgi:site-specific recombinase XerD/ribosomal protein L40E
MSENDGYITKFLELKRANGASEKTLKTQNFFLKQVSKCLNKDFKEADEQDIVNYISGKKGEGASNSSLALYKIVLKSFYRYLYDLPRHEYPNQVKNLNGTNNKARVPIRPENLLTKQDIAAPVKYCKNFRDEAMVVTLYESGLRVGEFVNINKSHLKFVENGVVLLAEGKTGQRRILLVEAVPYIVKWLENHPLQNEDSALWCSLNSPHKRLSEGTVEVFLKGLRKESGFNKPLNPHSFRHSRLTELAKYLSDAKLKVFAGWEASSKMSGVYVHLSGKDLDEDLLRIAGVEIKEKTIEKSPLRVKVCERCHNENPGTSEFCQVCGKPFNENLLSKEVDAQVRIDKLENDVTELRQELRMALKDYRNFTRLIIDEVKSKGKS